MIDPGLKDRVVLVTGGNHGIGAAIARAFAVQEAAVFITYLRLPPKRSYNAEELAQPGLPLYEVNRAASAEAVVASLRTAGRRVAAWEADLADPSVVPRLFDQVEAALGPVEVLVNNAAHWQPDSLDPAADSLETFSVETHDRHFAVNSRAIGLLMAEYVRRHHARDATWGRIVNISTDAADCFPGEVSYGASKLALESYTRSAAQEFGKYGITVNVIAPGPIQTDYIAPDFERELVARIPLGRIGEPADVADVVVFLASEQARWVTGQHFYVGGGHRM